MLFTRKSPFQLNYRRTTEVDKKTMPIYAIQKPNTDKVVVLLGDITRSDCKDNRK